MSRKSKSGRKRRRKSVGGRPRRWWALVGGMLLTAGLVWLLWPYWRLSGQFGQQVTAGPSRLYGRPLSLGVDEFISLSELERHLQELGYRRVDSSPSRGTYFRSSDPVALEVFLRPYPTVDGWTPAQNLRVAFSGRRISRISVAGREVGDFVLEPPQLASYYGPGLAERRHIHLDAMPEELVMAVLAAEDASFFDHAGISIGSILRAAIVNLRSGGVEQGGSTLTQQLVKNLYLTHERTFVRKLREGVLSVFLELRFDKNRLLETYLNEIYWGRDGQVSLMGAQAVSQVLFGKDVTELGLNEAATLAGMIQSPNRIDPRRHPERARQRRDFVLARMVRLGSIDETLGEATIAQPLPALVERRQPRHQGYFVDAVAREARERFGIATLAGSGYVLLSGLDLEDQLAAEEAVAAGLGDLDPTEGESELQGLLLSADPRDGQIRAYVGGRDYGRSQFDRASNAERQPGSSFKPVVFAAAFAAGVATPATLLDDSPLTMVIDGKRWSPQNVDRRFRGWVSARHTLEQSINVPTVRLAELVGWEQIVATARKMGISSRLRPLPSMALGAFEVTPRELLTVYSTLANGGRRPQLHLLRGMLSSAGEPIAGESVEEPRAALDSGVAYLVNHLLQGVLDRGTGRRVRTLGFEDPLAGKTGTSNEGRDSWFAGYAPNRATLVWVGFDENRASRPSPSLSLSGSRAALPIWTRFASQSRPAGGYSAFEAPANVRFLPIDTTTGGLATSRCVEVVTEAFLRDGRPIEMCGLHGGRRRHQFAEPVPPTSRRKRWWKRVFGRR